MKRTVLFTAGCIFLVIGSAGVVLPLLPGTPLLILAAFCFARSSPSVHQWLLARPGVGPVIRRWEEEGTIAVATKRRVTVVLIVACTISFALIRTAAAAAGFLVLIISLLTYIWSRPSSADTALPR